MPTSRVFFLLMCEKQFDIFWQKNELKPDCTNLLLLAIAE